MLLQHGTTDKVGLLALEEGLKPRGKKKNRWSNAPSRPDAVYLTNSYAPYFAQCAVQDPKKERMAILEIDTSALDEMMLTPDEDCLEQANRGQDGIRGDMRQRTMYYRKRLQDYNEGQWLMSLKYLGNCAHLGAVPSEAVTRLLLVDPDMWVDMILTFDPTITLANYRFCGARYRTQSRILFDPDAEYDQDLAPFDVERIDRWRDSLDRTKLSVIRNEKSSLTFSGNGITVPPSIEANS